MSPNSDPTPTWAAALKIAVAYAIIGALWILCSGWLLHHLVHDQLLLAKLEAVKGWFYVLVTAALLGWWLNRYFRQIRRAMDLLRKSEARFVSIFKASPVAIGISRLSDGVFIDANEAFVQLCGYPLQEILGRNAEQLHLWHSDNRTQVIAELHQKDRVVVEMQGRRKNGEVRDLLAFLQQVELDDQPCILGTLLDITERRRAEAALREGDERLRFALESCRIGTWDLDLANNSAVRSLEHGRIFGYDTPPTVWTREIFIDHVLPEDRAAVSESIKGAITTQSEMSFECRIRRADGQVRWIWVAGRYRVDASGKTRHLAGVIQDISERKAHVVEIERLSRLYATMSQINQCIVRVNSHLELAGEVAEIAVRFGGFKMAWIGRHNPQTREVVPLGWAGDLWESVRNFRHHLEDTAEERCLCTFVAGENRSCVFNDLSAVAEMSEWLTVMRQAGIRAAAVFPIRVRDALWGVFGVYESEPNVFHDKEIALLEEAAMDIGYAVENIDNEAQRRQAVDSLLESEERLRLFIEHAPAALGIFDRDMRYIAVSNRWLSDFGLEGKDAIGRSHYELFPEIGDALKELHRRGLAGEIIGADNERFERADGSVQYLHWAMHPWHDSAGAIGGIGIFTEDITKRKLAEEAAQRSEAHLRTLVDTLPDLVWLKDPQGVYLSCNARFESFLGAPEAEVVGKTDYDFLDRQLADFFRANDAAAVAAGGPRVNEEEITFASDGHRELLETIKTPMFDADGRPIGVLGIARDITMRRQQEKERANLEAQLQQARKMESVGRLAGGVAHDFNNMLTVILGHTDLLLAQMDKANPLHGDLIEIRKAGQRSAELTRQLLAFARKQTVAPKVIDLNRTLAGMAKMIKRLIGEDIDWEWIPGEQLWPVKIDPGQIDQILANLCINARDAIAGIGKVTIATANCVFDEAFCTAHAGLVPGEFVQLAVSDDGCGMDGETMAHLFEPFFTTKELGKGTGLGLATVYGVVKQNNGFINVSSEPGQGTAFTIYLPRHLAETVPLPEKEADKPNGRGHETVLLVEDEPAILQMTKQMLEREGYSVIAAGTPGEAMRLANQQEGAIQLLITDVVMPEMNGRDLAKNILTLCPRMKVLFMSGYTTDVIAHRGVIDEGVNFIEKPFTKRNLTLKVREVLNSE